MSIEPPPPEVKEQRAEAPSHGTFDFNSPGSPQYACVGGCVGPGLCPGIALFLAYGVGAGIQAWTGWSWLAWAVGTVVGIFLLAGGWRWIKPLSGERQSTPAPKSIRKP